MIALYPFVIQYFTGHSIIPAVVVDSPTTIPQNLEKPPGKIMSKLMQSGFAQNWFFKNEEITGKKEAGGK